MLSVFAIIISFGLASANLRDHPKIHEQTFGFNETVSASINSSVQYLYWFTAENLRINDYTFIKIHTSVGENATIEYPVWFDIEFQDNIKEDPKYWSSPSRHGILTFNKIFCTENFKLNSQYNVVVPIRISTVSNFSIPFEIVVNFDQYTIISNTSEITNMSMDVTFTDNYLLRLDQNFNVANISYAILHVESPDNICASVKLALQQCFQPGKSIGRSTRRLTMSKSATIITPLEDWKLGYTITILVHENDDECKDEDALHYIPLGDDPLHLKYTKPTRTKHISITLQDITDDNRNVTTLGTTVFLAVFLVFATIAIHCIPCPCRRNRQDVPDDRRSLLERDAQNDGHTNDLNKQTNKTDLSGSSPGSGSNNTLQAGSSSSLTIGNASTNGSQDGGAQNGNAEIYPNNPHEQEPRYFLMIFKRNHEEELGIETILEILFTLYVFWKVVQVFYSMYATNIVENGDENICHFNFKCLRPKFGMVAFNHMLSNVLYLFFGALFFVFVVNERKQPGYYFWITLSISLVLKSIASAVYCMCPNFISQQFDFIFTYCTVVICLLTMHMTRMQNVHYGLFTLHHIKYVNYGVVVMLLQQINWFWPVASFLHVLFSLMLSVHIDAVDKRISWRLVCPPAHTWRDIWQSFIKPFSNMSRELLLCNGVNILCFGISLLFLINNTVEFSSAFCIHVGGHMAFVMALTFLKPTNTVRTGLGWFVAAAITLIIYVICYAILPRPYSLEVSSAVSRTQNVDCLIFNFYDIDDIRRLISALGSFFLCMFLFSMTYKVEQPTQAQQIATNHPVSVQNIRPQPGPSQNSSVQTAQA